MATKSRLIKVFIGDKQIDVIPANILSIFDSRAFALSHRGNQWTWRRVPANINETAALTVLSWMRAEADKPQGDIQPLEPRVLALNDNRIETTKVNSTATTTEPDPKTSSSKTKNNVEEEMSEPDFPSCVTLHAAMEAFTLRHSLSGFGVRAAIVEYMWMAPLTLGEFSLLVDQIGHTDPTLVRLAIRAFETFRLEGREKGFAGVPDWEKIREFCLEKGIAELEP